MISFRRLRTGNSYGFTLVELLVTLTVITLITSVVVFNQADFADRLALTHVAAELELRIREMQVYGVSVREYQPNTSKFGYSYGVMFNTNTISGSPGPMGPISMWSFVDVTNNGRYNNAGGWSSCTIGGTSECLEITTLKQGVTISDLCAINASNGQNCRSNGGTSVPGRIDITFLRPDPNARFIFANPSGNSITFPNHRGAKIRLRSPRGKTLDLYIYTTGQISVR